MENNDDAWDGGNDVRDEKKITLIWLVAGFNIVSICNQWKFNLAFYLLFIQKVASVSLTASEI